MTEGAVATKTIEPIRRALPHARVYRASLLSIETDPAIRRSLFKGL